MLCVSVYPARLRLVSVCAGCSSLLQFLFAFGWLRVAETLYNPFGEDDEDFEITALWSRHCRVALQFVEDGSHPELSGASPSGSHLATPLPSARQELSVAQISVSPAPRQAGSPSQPGSAARPLDSTTRLTPDAWLPPPPHRRRRRRSKARPRSADKSSVVNLRDRSSLPSGSRRRRRTSL